MKICTHEYVLIFITKLQVANDQQCNFSLEEYEESGVKNDWEWFVVDRDRYGKSKKCKSIGTHSCYKMSIHYSTF